MAETAQRKDNRILQVKISEELKEKFDKKIADNNINKSALIRSWIEKWLVDNK